MKKPQIEDIYPLSPMQEGLLFHTLYDRDSRAYFVQTTYALQGRFERSAFEESWKRLFRRHAVLRTAFLYETQSRPLQVVLRDRLPEIQFTDLSALPETDQQARIETYRQQDLARGFDLQRDPLLRVTVFLLKDSQYQFVLSYHHILLDGWCFGILQQEFFQTYSTLLDGKQVALPPVPHYREYIRWLEKQEHTRAKEYWQRYLADYDHLTPLSTFKGTAANPEYLLKEHYFDVSLETARRLETLAARQHVTLNTLIQSLWGVLLSRYNGVEDVVFGAIVSGRPPDLPGVEGMVGVFINAVPVRIHCNAGQTFSSLLQQVQHASLASEPYHYFPLADIQALSPAGRALIDHVLIFENYPLEPVQDSPETSGVTISMLHNREQTHYDLNLVIVPGSSIGFKITYNGHTYHPDQIVRIGEHFRTAAQHLLEQPEMFVGELQILPKEERAKVLSTFNQTAVEYDHREQTLVEGFEIQVQKTPEAVAVMFQERHLTYRQLNVRANQVAQYLHAVYGLQPEARVGVLADRSDALVAGILGILKAGAAYVPIDPHYPAERIRMILEDSGCAVILCDRHYFERLPPHFASRAVDIRTIEQADTQNPALPISPAHLAYIIYTSGSTGIPKGCQVEHGNLLHYLRWANGYYFEEGIAGHFGLYSSLSFDLTVTSLFLPLLRGKILQVFPQDADVDAILRAIFDSGSLIDCVKLTPSHIVLLPQSGISATNVRLAIVGGEALSVEQVRILRTLNPEMKVYNEYGPTETTVGCIVKHIEPDEERVLIGTPIANTHIYILDQRFTPVPIEVPGEIYIGGAGVSRGYLNRDPLNREKFLPSPFIKGERLYKSGDLGRWLPDGNIEFLGRCDDQVKIRGYRIELGEIENQLLQHEAVKSTVVLAKDAKDAKDAGPVLTAYVACEHEVAANTLRGFLTSKLPDYMIPLYFVKLEEIPLTPNGKVDKHALPEPVEADMGRTTPPKAPRDALEAGLLRIWQEILQREQISIRDSFFELGGHSLKAMQIVSRIHQELEREITLREFFSHPTIAEIAALVKHADKKDFASIVPVPPRDYYDLSYAQKRLWILHRMGEEVNIAYNMPKAFLIEAVLDSAALQNTFNTIIDRHDALRTAFVEIEGEPYQKIYPEVPFHLTEIDLSHEDHAEERAREIANTEAVTPFDLTTPPLFRAILIKLAENRSVFVLTIHHIIGDGWSMNVLYQEILTLYDAYCRNLPNPLPPLSIQYKDFTMWQNARSFERDEAYWLKTLAGMPDQLRLPYDFAPQEERSFRGHTEMISLHADIMAGLRTLAAENKTTVSNVMLAILQLFLFQLTRQDDICVGMGIANRHHPDLENLIGFFVNILPIRIHFSPNMEFEELLAQVTQSTSEGFEHQDYPFDLLIHKLNPNRYANRQPILNVMYGFQSFMDVHIDLKMPAPSPGLQNVQPGEGLTVHPFELSFAISKFDLTLFVFDTGQELDLYFEYDTDLFAAGTIKRYLAALERFARMLAAH